MAPSRPVLRFFRREDLEPAVSGVGGTPGDASYLSAEECAQLAEFCQRSAQDGHYLFTREVDALPGHLRMFVAMLAALGAVRVSSRGAEVVQSGRLARHVPQILRIYLDKQHVLIDDWSSRVSYAKTA